MYLELLARFVSEEIKVRISLDVQVLVVGLVVPNARVERGG